MNLTLFLFNWKNFWLVECICVLNCMHAHTKSLQTIGRTMEEGVDMPSLSTQDEGVGSSSYPF